MVLQQALILKWQLRMFNEYFSSVFTHENITFLAVDSTGTPLLSDVIEFTPEVVCNKIMNLHSSKSSGPDVWPIPVIIKSCG